MNDDAAIISALQVATNKRQAAKIRDVSSTATLCLERENGFEMWARGVNEGLYVAEFNAQNAYVNAGLYKLGRVAIVAQDAVEIRVVRDREELPEEIRRCRHTGGEPQ